MKGKLKSVKEMNTTRLHEKLEQKTQALPASGTHFPFYTVSPACF